MASNTAIHLGIGFTADPRTKYAESDLISQHIAEFEATGGQIQVLLRGATDLPLSGKNRGAMTVAERARESKQRQNARPTASGDQNVKKQESTPGD